MTLQSSWSAACVLCFCRLRNVVVVTRKSLSPAVNVVMTIYNGKACLTTGSFIAFCFKETKAHHSQFHGQHFCCGISCYSLLFYASLLLFAIFFHRKSRARSGPQWLSNCKSGLFSCGIKLPTRFQNFLSNGQTPHNFFWHDRNFLCFLELTSSNKLKLSFPSASCPDNSLRRVKSSPLLRLSPSPTL